MTKLTVFKIFYYVLIGLTVMGVFMLNPIMIAQGIVLILIVYPYTKSYCSECKSCGTIKLIKTESLNMKKDDPVKYVEFKQIKGSYMRKKLVGVIESDNYRPYHIDSPTGPEYYTGRTKTNQYAYENIPYTENMFLVYNCQNVTETVRNYYKCSKCGHEFTKDESTTRVLDFIHDIRKRTYSGMKLGTSKEDIAKVIEYLNDGYEFRSELRFASMDPKDIAKELEEVIND